MDGWMGAASTRADLRYLNDDSFLDGHAGFVATWFAPPKGKIHVDNRHLATD